MTPRDNSFLGLAGCTPSHRRGSSHSQECAVDTTESPWRQCVKCGMVKDSLLSFTKSPIECNGCVRLAAGPLLQSPATAISLTLPAVPQPPSTLSVTVERLPSDSQGSRNETVSPVLAADQWRRCALCGIMKEMKQQFRESPTSCDACCARGKPPTSPASALSLSLSLSLSGAQKGPMSPPGLAGASANESFDSSVGSTGWVMTKQNSLEPPTHACTPPGATSTQPTNATPRAASPQLPSSSSPTPVSSSTHSSPSHLASEIQLPLVSVTRDAQPSAPQAGSPNPPLAKAGLPWPTPSGAASSNSPTTPPTSVRRSSGPFRPLKVSPEPSEAAARETPPADHAAVARQSPPNVLPQWQTPRSGGSSPSPSPVPPWSWLYIPVPATPPLAADLPVESHWKDVSNTTPMTSTPRLIQPIPTSASAPRRPSEHAVDGEVVDELLLRSAEEKAASKDSGSPRASAVPGWRTPRDLSGSGGAQQNASVDGNRRPSYLTSDKLRAVFMPPVQVELTPSSFGIAPDYPTVWTAPLDYHKVASHAKGSSPSQTPPTPATPGLTTMPAKSDASPVPMRLETFKVPVQTVETPTATARHAELPQGGIVLWRKCTRCGVLKGALEEFSGGFAMACKACMAEAPPARTQSPPLSPPIPPLPLSPRLRSDGGLSQSSSSTPSPLPSPAVVAGRASPALPPKPASTSKAGQDQAAAAKPIPSPRVTRHTKATPHAASPKSPRPKHVGEVPESSTKPSPKSNSHAKPPSPTSPNLPRPPLVVKADSGKSLPGTAKPADGGGVFQGSPSLRSGGPAMWQVHQYRICTTCHEVKNESEFSLSELDCMQCVASNAPIPSPSDRSPTPKRSPCLSVPAATTPHKVHEWPEGEGEEDSKLQVFSDGSSGDDEDIHEQLGRCSSAQRLRLFTKLEKRKARRGPRRRAATNPIEGSPPSPAEGFALCRNSSLDPPPAGNRNAEAPLSTPPAQRITRRISAAQKTQQTTPDPAAFMPSSTASASQPMSADFNAVGSFFNSPCHQSSQFPFVRETVDEFFDGLQVAWENLGGLPLTLRDLIMQLGSVPLVRANAAQPQLCRYCCKKMGSYISRVSFAFFSTDTSWTCSDCYNAGLVYHSELPTDNKERLFFINIIHYCFKKAVSDNTMLLEFLDFIPFVYECNIRLKPDSFPAKLKETFRSRCQSGPGMTQDEMAECCAELKLKGLTKSNFRLFAEVNERLNAHGFCKLLFALTRPKSPHLARMPLEEKEKQSISSLAPISRPPGNSVELQPTSGEGIQDVLHFDYRKAHKLRVLGVGGMSIVWLIDYKGMNLAAKTPKPATKPEHVKLMFKAARLQQRVKHPNVLRVLGVFEDSEWPCILLEPIEGGSIADLCLAPMPLSLKWKLAIELAQGIDALHTTKPPILHRDLKGSNVFLTSDHTVKIADFDFAVELCEGRTKGSCGTPGFMAPELLAGAHYDQTADVFSFGSILYELFEELFPFSKEVDFRREDLNQGDWDKIATMLTMEGMRPALGEKCPRCMRHLIRECWAPNPEHRPRPGTLCSRVRALPMPAE
eukprot:GGOE01040461.1.p1 GENE.GGOE01040461.1~~GGOE01040461.1.p1  ORF type:complete len:1755 (+),score=332.90 GGOE01040461.1:616-5265(+)